MIVNASDIGNQHMFQQIVRKIPMDLIESSNGRRYNSLKHRNDESSFIRSKTRVFRLHVLTLS